MDGKKRWTVMKIAVTFLSIHDREYQDFDDENSAAMNSTNTSYSPLQEHMMEKTNEYISNDNLQSMKFAFGMILIPTFSLFGSIGNILSLVVLFQHRMRSPTNSVLAALSISDLLFLLHCLLFFGINVQIYQNPTQGRNIRNVMFPVFGAYGSLVTARITSWLTALLSLERFIAVYFPMRAKRMCNKTHTIIAILGIYIITILLFLPYALKYKVIKKTKMNQTISVLRKSELGTNEDFFQLYGIILNVLFRFLPIAVLCTLNILIILVIRKTWAKRQSISNSGNSASSISEQLHITIMLIVVTFLFAACILPGAVNSLAQHFWTEYDRFGKARNLVECISYVTYFLETLNSSVNFIIYMALSTRFCMTYKEVFCCKNRSRMRSFSLASSKERTFGSLNIHNKRVSVSSTKSLDSRHSGVHSSIAMRKLSPQNCPRGYSKAFKSDSLLEDV